MFKIYKMAGQDKLDQYLNENQEIAKLIKFIIHNLKNYKVILPKSLLDKIISKK